MLLTCPNCGTQYMVKDGAIPPQGRQVRCAACKHSWHQDPEAAEDRDEPVRDDPSVAGQAFPVRSEDEAPQEWADASEARGDDGEIAPDAPEDDDQSLAEATLIEPRSGPEAEERAYESAATDAGFETTGAERADTAPRGTMAELAVPGFSPDEQSFASSDRVAMTEEWPPQSAGSEEVSGATSDPQSPSEPAGQPMNEEAVAGPSDRAPAETADWSAPPGPEAQDDEFSPFVTRDDDEVTQRRGPITKLLLALLMIAALAAAFWFLAPPEWKARLGLVGAGGSPLALVTEHMDRQRLESGNELLTVTGRVINPTAKVQAVPPLQAQLKTRTGQVVYSWTIAPPARTLPPGASASFNSAEVNVPPGGEELTITLGASRA